MTTLGDVGFACPVCGDRIRLAGTLELLADKPDQNTATAVLHVDNTPLTRHIDGHHPTLRI